MNFAIYSLRFHSFLSHRAQRIAFESRIKKNKPRIHVIFDQLLPSNIEWMVENLAVVHVMITIWQLLLVFVLNELELFTECKKIQRNSFHEITITDYDSKVNCHWFGTIISKSIHSFIDWNILVRFSCSTVVLERLSNETRPMSFNNFLSQGYSFCIEGKFTAIRYRNILNDKQTNAGKKQQTLKLNNEYQDFEKREKFWVVNLSGVWKLWKITTVYVM